MPRIAKVFSLGVTIVPVLVASALAGACSSDPAADAGGGTTAAPAGSGGGAATGTTTTGGGDGDVVGSCTRTNPFSKGGECKEYTGEAWTAESAKEDCDASMGGPGTFTAGAACAPASVLGTCAVTKDDGTSYLLYSEGADAGQCAMAKTGCETFAKGAFTPGATCGGAGAGGGSTGGGYGAEPFVQPYRVCKDPLPGEPPGQSEGGQVCTWTLISASTEVGRRYDDYASCGDVLTQRPYWPAPAHATTAKDDPRLADAAYMAEVAWAKAQVESSACVCCHTKRLAPAGASQWLTDAEGIWLDGVSDSGLAMMAGLADSTALGAFPAADNNGFDRTELGLPTTDVARMRKLLLGEWARRGLTDADAAKVPPFGGPLVDQLSYEPEACGPGQGLDADGKLVWTGGDARYVYVLEAGAKNPGVPPNLDEPEGTRWLVDVPTKSPAFASGLAYGDVSGGLRQRVPASGAPVTLAPGATYYLYVLKDIGVPVTRCLFKAP